MTIGEHVYGAKTVLARRLSQAETAQAAALDQAEATGVEVITPNPFTSGGARWNVLAGYGAMSDRNTDRAAGTTYLSALFHNVPVQDDSARKALQTFTGGKGDAILSYENEAIFAQQNKQAIDYVVPDSTILIENPVAVTRNSAHPTEAKAFLTFLHSPQAQKIFADNGYRPVISGVPGADKFPPGSSHLCREFRPLIKK